MLLRARKDRCKICHKERALRLCPRKDKGLCYRCCNELRIDLKCPQDCPYAPALKDDSIFPSFKAVNNIELTEVNKLYIDRWVNKKSEFLDGLSPIELKEKDPKLLLERFGGFQYPGNFPVDYLMQRLGLSIESITLPQTAEEVVAAYLDDVIALEYDNLRSYTSNSSPLADLAERYKRIVSKIAKYKKLTKYSFIHTGLSEDAQQAIVFVELNLKDEFSFVLRYNEGKWYIRQTINGNPSEYFKENKRYQEIAEALGQGQQEKAFYDIAEAMRSYPDSSDLYYYRGIYYSIIKDYKKAKEDLLDAIALDNGFVAPYMNLGLLYLNEKNYKEAKLWFAALVQIKPDEIDAINNLAITHLANGEKEEAIALWKNILAKYPTYEMARKNLELYG